MYSTMSANPLQQQTSCIVAIACDHHCGHSMRPSHVSAYDIKTTHISGMMLAIQ